MNSVDAAIHAFAARQLGLLTRADVLVRGGSDDYIRTCLARGRWQQLHPGVYLTGSARPTWLQRQLAACLAAGPNAASSHRAGAALWYLDGAGESVVELTCAQPYCPRPRGARLHRTIRWDPVDLTVRRGVPVTSVNRTLIDYGAVVPRILVERAMEDAFRRGLTTEGALRRRLAQIGGPGCRGSAKIRWALDHRFPGRPARSGFEVITGDVLREFGFPTPHRRFPVPDESGRIVAEIDLAFPDEMVAVEPNGEKWHSTRRARIRDVERIALLRRLGWNVVEGTWDEIVHHPAAFAARVRAALCASVRA